MSRPSQKLEFQYQILNNIIVLILYVNVSMYVIMCICYRSKLTLGHFVQPRLFFLNLGNIFQKSSSSLIIKKLFKKNLLLIEEATKYTDSCAF